MENINLGKVLPEWFLLIDEFPDINRIYTGVEVEQFIGRQIPKEDDEYIKDF